MINFSIPKVLLKKIDTAARNTARSRSEFLREAARSFLDDQQRRTALFDLVRLNAKKSNLTDQQALQLALEAQQWARKTSK